MPEPEPEPIVVAPEPEPVTPEDIVLLRDIPDALADVAALWTGCVSGALIVDDAQFVVGAQRRPLGVIEQFGAVAGAGVVDQPLGHAENLLQAGRQRVARGRRIRCGQLGAADLEQPQREEVMLNFKNNKVKILVATDIVARGIDIEDIGLVLNYDVPHDPEDYIHRIGRTARAAASGAAMTFVSEEEQGKFHQIEKFIERDIRKAELPESVGEGPKYAPDENRGRFGRGDRSGRNDRDRRSERPAAATAAAAAEPAAAQPASPDSDHASGRGEGNRGTRDRRRHRGGRNRGRGNKPQGGEPTPQA